MGFTKYSPLPPIHGARISDDDLSIRMRAAELGEKDPADQGAIIPVFCGRDNWMADLLLI